MRILSFVFLMICGPLAAQETGLVTLQTREDSRNWAGVGRLDIIDKGFCTAALIQNRLILTAAHCLYDTDGSLISPDRFVFEAGLRDGRAEASRGISRILPHPDYKHDGPSTDAAEVVNDIALLELDQPIRNGRIMPYAIAPKPQAGDEIGIVSYGRDRANAASLQEVCKVIERQSGVILMDCDITLRFLWLTCFFHGGRPPANRLGGLGHGGCRGQTNLDWHIAARTARTTPRQL